MGELKQQSEDEVVLRQYLLGELTQEECSRVEERLFLNSDYFQQLQAAEDDLVDDYVYEELPLIDRERFETHFLSQHGHSEDIKIARALKMYVSAEAEPMPSTLASTPATTTQPRMSSRVAFLPALRNFNALARLSLGVAALIILAIGIWLVIKAMRSQDQSHPLEVQQPAPPGNVQAPEQRKEIATDNQSGKSSNVEQERHVERQDLSVGSEEKRVANRARRDATESREPSSEGGATRGGTLAVTLIPGVGVRGGGDITKVQLSPDVRLVKLELPLIGSNSYRSYQATLRTGSDTIRTWAGLKSAGIKELTDVVPVIVPAKFLHPTNYQIKLTGITAEGKTRDIATYAFQVEEK